MKKNKIFILMILFVATLIPMFTACTKNSKDELKNYEKAIKESIKNATSMETTLTTTDQDVVVYKYVKSITFLENNSAYVSTDVSSLDKSFELSTKTTSETIDNVNKNEIQKISLSKKYFNNYMLENQTFVGEISQDNMKNIFNYDIKIKDVAKLIITFEEEKVIKIECTYETESGKQAVLTTNYEY